MKIILRTFTAGLATLVLVVSGAAGAFFPPLALPALLASIWLARSLRGVRIGVLGERVPAAFPLFNALLLIPPAPVCYFALVPRESGDNAWLGLLVPAVAFTSLAAFYAIAAFLPLGEPRDTATFGAVLLFTVTATVALILVGYLALTIEARDLNDYPLRSRFQAGFAVLGLDYFLVWTLLIRRRLSTL